MRVRVRSTVAVVATLAVLGGCAATGAEPDPGAAPPASSAAPSSASPEPSPSADEPSAVPSEAPTETRDPSVEPTQEPSSEPSADTDEPRDEPSAKPGDGPSTESGHRHGKRDGEGRDEEGGKEGGKGQEEKSERPAMLAYGATGERVVALQSRLQDLGYFLPEVDGDYGPATQQAVWALQKTAGEYRDGVVGPKTQEALDRGARPSAVSSSGKVVEIDLDRQLLLAVEDGRVRRIFNASSGNGELFEAKGRQYQATTPRGTFAVYMERNYLHESTLELGAMYRPKYFTGGIAVHGSPSIPPYPASHGCIRVSNSAINWLWDSWGMPIGTTVIVH